MLVSEMEKNAETIKSTTKATSKECSGISSKETTSHGQTRIQERGANGRESQGGHGRDEDEGGKSGEGPTQGSAPAPAVDATPGQQSRVDAPGQDTEGHLLVDPERLSYQLLREEHAACQRQSQQNKPQRDNPEKQPLDRQQRWQRLQIWRQAGTV